MSEPAREYNFDGLVGPTHNYAGLGSGNLAAQNHGQQSSNPRAAALEGLQKMKRLLDLGIPQGIIPPQDRPDISALRRLGFSGDAKTILAAAHKTPRLLAACTSASAMWTANAATISPSADTGANRENPAARGRVHITPANLTSQLHRALEVEQTTATLRRLFPWNDVFAHHAPLPANAHTRDEGAANHLRLAAHHDAPGIELFVYGEDDAAESTRPTRFPARQTRLASEAVARLHGLSESRTLFIQQAPEAIDAGVFHNDVIAVANENVLLCHERAFAARNGVVDELCEKWDALSDTSEELCLIEVTEAALPIADAVSSYLFNSQLITRSDGGMTLIAPQDCAESSLARGVIEWLVAGDNPVTEAQYLDVRQSMHNGGGPACLRLRVVLTEAEAARVHQAALLTPALYDSLTAWVKTHYRDRLMPEDLADPQLLNESRIALDALTRILDLPGLYAFQR